ncbi:tetratricopeptide repeat protein, partial [Candidatus Poribacteria bacterium]|nr:tetratricopeptide repeat protein [Candidatus Poribacteria bacterium]
ASPSALHFTLHSDTTIFCEMMSSYEQLDSSDDTREWLTRLLNSQFATPLLEMLISDMRFVTYSFLHAKLGIRIAQVSTRVRIATSQEMYVDAIGGGDFSLSKAAEDLRAGQLVSYVDPMDFNNDGLAFLNLNQYQDAMNSFKKAFAGGQTSHQKAIVLNNIGLTFLYLKQYQKAIECFEEGIALDSEGEVQELRLNKKLAEEDIARTTDIDNLTEPIQTRFLLNQPVTFEETLFCEFKEITSEYAARSITDTSDIYAVAFLNRKGGRIFWGVRDSDRFTVGVTLDDSQRENVRRKVSEKLGAIRPPISVEDWHLELHNVYDLQGNIIEDLWVVELLVSPPQRKDVFYTSKGELHVKTEGGKRRLKDTEITEFIRTHIQDDTETE